MRNTTSDSSPGPPSVSRIVLVCGVVASLLTVGYAADAAQPDFKVIVNAANPTVSIKVADLSQMYLRKKATWSHGVKVEPVELPKSSAVRNVFNKAVHGKSAHAMAAYWRKRVFLGEAVPPAALENDRAVRAFVEANPGAVGYVSGSAPTESVKVIEVR